MKTGSVTLRLAAAAVLLAAAQAGAQDAPYQSPKRMLYGSGLGQVAPPRGAYFEPRLDGAIQYADNINLATDSKNQDNAFGLEVAPGFYASYGSDRFQGAADYSLIGRVWDKSDYNDVTQRLAANGSWTAVPDLLQLQGTASYDDTVLDPRFGLNYGGLGMFGTSNLVERATASVSPVLHKNLRDFVVDASYRYGQVWYLNAGKGRTPTVGFVSEDNSRDQDARFSFGTNPESHRLNGDVFYEWQKSEYDVALPYQYERAGVNVDAQLSRTLYLVGDGGRESALDVSTTAGGLDSDFWSAGLRWQPNDRSSAEARVGDRFFGRSYSADIRHQAKLLEFTASYSESPQVETRLLSLGGFTPGELPPGVDPGVDFGRFNSKPYVSKDTRVGVTAKGSRTLISLTGFDTKRDYVGQLRGDERGTGVYLDASRRLAADLSVDFMASYTDYERAVSPTVPTTTDFTHDYDTQVILRGNRDFGPRFVASLEGGFLNRSGATSYDGWWVGLRGRWTPSLR